MSTRACSAMISMSWQSDLTGSPRALLRTKCGPQAGLATLRTSWNRPTTVADLRLYIRAPGSVIPQDMGNGSLKTIGNIGRDSMIGHVEGRAGHHRCCCGGSVAGRGGPGVWGVAGLGEPAAGPVSGRR